MSTNSIVSELLKRKILDRDINIEEIVEEDKQAILIFLRNTAFGSEYKFTLTDPKTEKEFETTIDLSEINLTTDVNGEYSYFLQKSNVEITFKFLTQKQEDEINKIRDSWNGIGVAPIVTKQLEFMIKSIGGVRDPLQIRNFIETKMPIKDSQDFKKFVKENKPRKGLLNEILFLIKKGFSYSDIISMPVYVRRYYINYIIELES
jgi:hypothetical protein